MNGRLDSGGALSRALALLLLSTLAAILLTGCSVDGTWPFLTPTATPQPPTATAVPPTPTPQPTATPLPPTATPTPRPTATATPKPPTPTATATPKPAPTSSYTGPASIGNLIVKGKPETGFVAVSFDAGGKDPGLTGTVLDALKRFNGHATFFLTGEWSEANPALVKRMVAEGHELANHTYDHPNLPDVADQEIISQVTRTEAAVQKVAGVPVKHYIRPPFGAWDQRVLGVLQMQDYQVIYWTLDSGDWLAETSVEDVSKKVGTKAGAGDIVVMHCYAEKTAKALPAALEMLVGRGLKLGTISQVLGK